MDIDPKYKEAVCPVLLKLKRDDKVYIKEIISDLEDVIVQSYSSEATFDSFKGSWIKRIGTCAALLKLKLDNTNVSFKKIERRIGNILDEDADSSSASTKATATASRPAKAIAASSTSTKATTAASTLSKKSEMNVPFTDDLKQTFVSTFRKLDSKQFWHLDSTEGISTSVEERLFNYGLKCQYLHPIHSFIVDLGDKLTLLEIFTQRELLEIQAFGDSLLLHPIDEAIVPGLSKLEELNDIFEIHDYFRKLDYHPLLDNLVAWMAMSITDTSFLFLKNEPIRTSFESDNLYRSWDFVNAIFFYTNIEAISKEKSSIASSKAVNSKRKLSSMEEVPRKAAGRKMDTIYVAAEMELGALEIGGKKNDTKDLIDGQLKLPIVMKDMLKFIADKHPAIKEKVKIVGYNIQDNYMSYMSMDAPKGYVSRIRRLRPVQYPTSCQDYSARMPALLKIAYNGYRTMNDTLSAIQSCKTELLPVIHFGDTLSLPPTLKPSKTAATKASESSSGQKSS